MRSRSRISRRSQLRRTSNNNLTGLVDLACNTQVVPQPVAGGILSGIHESLRGGLGELSYRPEPTAVILEVRRAIEAVRYLWYLPLTLLLDINFRFNLSQKVEVCVTIPKL